MLSHLSLFQFRKYKELTLEIPAGAARVAFVGQNTAGKTNILEALYFLCLLKSFRTHSPQEMMLWGEHVMRVEGTFDDNTHLAVGVASRPKRQRKYEINEAEVTVDTYVGTKTVVFFSPDDINMLLLSPANRRRYLDVILCQTNKKYLRSFAAYTKVLKQRNALLRAVSLDPSAADQLPYWEGELLDHAMVIMQGRRALTDAIATILPHHYAQIAGSEADVTLKYASSMPDAATKEELHAVLNTHRDRDIIMGSTAAGPHRDDVHFMHTGRHVESFASRGDTRSYVLALKLGELAYMQTLRDDAPLLLMDDVFSELDTERQERLLAHLPSKVQTFITTTHIPSSLKAQIDSMLVYQVGMDGNVQLSK